MGANQPTVEIVQHTISEEILQSSIVQNLSLLRLKLSHSSNIYLKCEYLQKNFDKFQIEQIFLGKKNWKVLDHNMIAGEVIQVISRIFQKQTISKLRVLCLSFNQIVCDSLKYLPDAKFLHLTTLYLDHNKIADDGCFYITRPNMPSLETLDLTSNLIEQQGCKHLARTNWPNLRTLLASQNRFSSKGLLYFSKAQWPNLVFVQAKNCSFQPTKALQNTKFRTQIKFFRIQLE